jgi:hypothetical protein
MSGQRPVEWVPVSSRLKRVTVVTPRRAGKSRAARRVRTDALLQERAAIEWDVLSRISMQRQVFDVLGGCWGPLCGAKRAPRPGSDFAAHCSRRAEHTGRHFLSTGKYVVAVWS